MGFAPRGARVTTFRGGASSERRLRWAIMRTKPAARRLQNEVRPWI